MKRKKVDVAAILAQLEQPCEVCELLTAQAESEGQYLRKHGLTPSFGAVEIRCQLCRWIWVCDAGESGPIFRLTRRAGRSELVETQRDFLGDRWAHYVRSAGVHSTAARLAGLAAYEKRLATRRPDLSREAAPFLEIARQQVMGER